MKSAHISTQTEQVSQRQRTVGFREMPYLDEGPTVGTALLQLPGRAPEQPPPCLEGLTAASVSTHGLPEPYLRTAVKRVIHLKDL